jgi:hypothetical protein
MKKIKPIFVLFFLVIGFLWVSEATPATVNTASCSQSDVQTALNSASSGSTVVVPAGQCTWSSSVSIPTGVTLQGAGIGNTIISGNGATLSSNSRLTDFEFAIDVDISVKRGAQNWRIDHCKVQQSGSQNKWIEYGNDCSSQPHPSGVIDNNIIINGRIGAVGCQNDVFDDHQWYTYFRYYTDPAEKVYIEDNVITQTDVTGVVDGNYSGRYVIRYNTITEGYFEAHGARDSRGLQSWEIYRNNITNNSICPLASNIRGGTGVIFDNDCSGDPGQCDWHFNTERCATSYQYSGLCNGTSAWDTTPHPAIASGYLCRDAFAGKDSQLGSGRASDPPYRQESLPGYMWGNTENKNSTWNAVIDCSKIVEGRDIYMDDSSAGGFGKGGVAIGTLAERPSTCTTGTAYWATDQGSWNRKDGRQGVLYKCTAPNTWTLYYTPYTYPYPWRQTGEDIQPPKNLRIVQ